MRKRIWHWIDSRQGSKKTHTLNHRRLYIVPTKLGFGFLFALIILWVIGSNYQNNLVIALVFFLISIFIVSLIHTHMNLSGIQFAFVRCRPVFLGESSSCVFTAENTTSTWREDVEFWWRDGEKPKKRRFSFAPHSNQQFSVPYTASMRGRRRLVAMGVRSVYPLGLFQCWTWLKWQPEVLVYPKPITTENMHIDTQGEEASRSNQTKKQGENLHGLRDFQIGEPLNRVSWKHFARGRGMLVKEFERYSQASVTLDLSAYSQSNLELALSMMTYDACQLSRAGLAFGVRLPGREIPSNEGEHHLQSALEALAIFQQQEKQQGGSL